MRTHPDLDIVDEAAVARILAELKPDWAINAAAYTAADLAEDQPMQAYAVNDTAVASLARSLQNRMSIDLGRLMISFARMSWARTHCSKRRAT